MDVKGDPDFNTIVMGSLTANFINGQINQTENKQERVNLHYAPKGPDQYLQNFSLDSCRDTLFSSVDKTFCRLHYVLGQKGGLKNFIEFMYLLESQQSELRK